MRLIAESISRIVVLPSKSATVFGSIVEISSFFKKSSKAIGLVD